MPNIAIDYTPACEQSAGIGRLVRHLVEALARQSDEFTYSLFSAKNAQCKVPADISFELKQAPLNSRNLARLWHRLHIPFPVELITGPIDLFHATDFVLPPTRSTTRTILTVHDLTFVRVPEAASPQLRAYLQSVVPRSIERATHIIADSEATKNDILDIYGTHESKIDVVMSAVDHRFRLINDEVLVNSVRQRYKIDDRAFLLAVGTVQPRKNYGRLIQALAGARSKGHDIQLVIAGGKGWLESEIYRTLYETDMEDHVTFTGFVADEDLPLLYNAAHTVVFVSLYEGFGFPVLEGMACGRPVITSNVSSMPEVAGSAAYLVDPTDMRAIQHAIEDILTDQSLYQQLVDKGLKRTTEFSWERSADQLRQIYHRVLSA